MKTNKEVQNQIEKLKTNIKVLEGLLLKDNYKINTIIDIKSVKRDTQRDIDTLNWILK